MHFREEEVNIWQISLDKPTLLHRALSSMKKNYLARNAEERREGSFREAIF